LGIGFLTFFREYKGNTKGIRGARSAPRKKIGYPVIRDMPCTSPRDLLIKEKNNPGRNKFISGYFPMYFPMYLSRELADKRKK